MPVYCSEVPVRCDDTVAKLRPETKSVSSMCMLEEYGPQLFNTYFY